MVFWRNRSEKKVETPASVDTETTVAEAVAEAAKPAEPEAPTNVVTLVTSRIADRLADRLADVAIVTDSVASQLKKSNGRARAERDEQSRFAGQQRAVAKIRAVFSSKSAEPLLILGEPGLGRIEIAKALAGEVSGRPADDWIYIVEPSAPSRAKAIAIAGGDGSKFIRDVRLAIEKAATAFDRHIKSDEHRITLDLLEEEARYRGEQAVEHIRRRAEEQNIAVVKSLDGYVLAPMHEGRVVRSDVFRALPDALKRNVEAKITALEDELQTIVATQPDAEFETHEKYDALMRQTALRVIGPCLAAVEETFADNAPAIAALGAIKQAFVALAANGASADRMHGLLLDVCGNDADEAADTVVFARHVTPAALCGEIGRDALGRVTLMPGYLARARSGTVILEAWKLAADPKAWTALSSALQSREFAPLSAPGLAVKADLTPLTATVVLIADPQSWSKLEAIEPGVARHFPHVAKLAETVLPADLGEDQFAKFIARLSAYNGLKPANEGVIPLLYKDAVRRGGGRVSLSKSAVLHVLRAAHAIAQAHNEIRVSDINAALSQRADGDAP